MADICSWQASCKLAVTTFCLCSQVKRDMVAIKHELDTVQQVKEEIEELREYVDRLEENTHRRKLRLLEQVGSSTVIANSSHHRSSYIMRAIYIVLFPNT